MDKRQEVISHSIVLVAIILLIFFFKFQFIDATYYFDAMGGVALPAYDMYINGPDFFSFNGHPTLIFNLLAFTWKIFSPTLIVSRLFLWFFATIGLYSAFRLGQWFGGFFVGIGSLLLTFFNQVIFAQLGTLHDGIFLMTFTLLTLLFYVTRRYWGVAVFGLLLCMTKETGLIVLVALFVHYLFVESRNYSFRVKKWHLISILLPICTLGIWWYFHSIHMTWMLRTDLITGSVNLFSRVLHNLFRHFIYDFTEKSIQQIQWLLSLVIVISLPFLSKRERSFYFLFGGIYIAYVVLFSYTLELIYYVVPIIPLLTIMSAYSLHVILPDNRMKPVFYCIAIVVIVLLFTQNYYGFRSSGGWDLGSNMEYTDLLNVTEEAMRFVHQQYPNVSIYTCWPEAQTWGYNEFNRFNYSFHTYRSSQDYKPEDLMVYSPHSVCDIEESFFQYLTLLRRFEKNNKTISVYGRPFFMKRE